MNNSPQSISIACVGKVNSGKTSWCKRIIVCFTFFFNSIEKNK